MVSDSSLREPPPSPENKLVSFEEPERFQRTVLRAASAGVAAALVIWTIWAISALTAAHLSGWPAKVGAWLAVAPSGGLLTNGGAGIGAGSLPLYPALVIGLSVVAYLAWLKAHREGKVTIETNLSSPNNPADLVATQSARTAARVRTVHPRVAAAQILVSGLLAAALPFLLSTKPTFGLFTSGLIVGFLLTRQKVPGVGNGARRLAVLGCGFSTLVGVASIEAIASHAWLETYLPGPLPLMAYAAALGGFVVLGVGAAHLSAPTDPVKTHYRAKAPELRGELRDVARRAEETYRATTAVLTARAGDRAEALRLQERLATVTHRVLDLAARCQALRAAVGDETELRLAKEIAELERKAQATSDEIAKSHYERAQSTLAAQHAQLERIRMGRDRALATMHSQLALLERARLSLIGLQSSDTSRLTAELCLLSESLDEASNAMDAETEAILVVTASA